MNDFLGWITPLLVAVTSFQYVCKKGNPRPETLTSAKILWLVLSCLPGIQWVMAFFGSTAALATIVGCALKKRSRDLARQP